jgi:hypothetical protein
VDIYFSHPSLTLS